MSDHQRTPQCPNCHSFKVESVTANVWSFFGVAMILGLFLLPVAGLGVILWAFGIAVLFRLPFVRGKMHCKPCGWDGTRAEAIIG